MQIFLCKGIITNLVPPRVMRNLKMTLTVLLYKLSLKHNMTSSFFFFFILLYVILHLHSLYKKKKKKERDL